MKRKQPFQKHKISNFVDLKKNCPTNKKLLKTGCKCFLENTDSQ